MLITFFKAGIPLTKSFKKESDGSITKTSYPNVYEVTSLAEDVKDMKQFAAAIKKHAGYGHCLVKGNPTRDLVSESRAGTTDSNAATDWVVFDVDGLPNVKTPDDFMKLIGFGNVSYVVQYSASYGIENHNLRCHIFVQLDKPMAAPLIKQWLIQLNHTVPALKDAMGLTKTGNSLSWALDISACQNDKLLYIAPPKLTGVRDPLGKTPRIDYVQKPVACLSIAGAINSTTQNRNLTNKRINEIRLSMGYPERKTSYKMHGNMEVMVKPDSCIVTDIKSERGYVYFNLNGGDSWGYYHREDNPDYIHNFKGEPAYLTKELLPEYWEQITTETTRINSNGVVFLAFCDRKTGVYWRGTYDVATNFLNINMAKNETQVRHFAKQNGVPLGEYIPEWDLIFDPQDTTRVDVQNKVVNLFEPTDYMLKKPRSQPNCPKVIHKVIHHALGSDDAAYEHFINWIAFILQNRTMAKTAWILTGTQGTGKGVLMGKILRPIFGVNQTAVRRATELNEKYNDYMERALLFFVDEIEVKIFSNEKGVMADIKNYIVEELITIRAMYKTAREVPNYCSLIFNSNKPTPVTIDKEDRRFNVGKYQPNKLVLTDAEYDNIENELQAFHDHLMGIQVDTQKARTPLMSQERDEMMSISETSLDSAVSAMRDGSLEFFIEQLPTTDRYMRNQVERNRVEDYIDCLKAVIEHTDMESGVSKISRDTLRGLLNYVVGNIPDSPHKFTSMLKHHRIHMKTVRIGKETPSGTTVTWTDLEKFESYKRKLNPEVEATKPAKPVKATAKLKAVK